MFELVNRDAAGRISKFTIRNKKIILPDIAIVVDPSKNFITPKELQKKFKTNLIMTNAFLIKRDENLSEQASKGLHKFFDFDGIIMCDSGAYQTMFGQKINITNKEVIEFQEKIKPDIGVFLDVPSGDFGYREAEKTVAETIKRAKECKELTKNSKILWAGPIQGGSNLELVQKCAKQMAKLNFDIYPIGSIVPRLIRYDFKTVCEQIITAKMNLPSNKPFHSFGLGIPQFLSLAVAIGSDIFDCAAYALFAYEDRYMTLEGTHQLADLQEFPCSCEECSKHSPEEVKKLDKPERERFLAQHNLHVTFAEIRTIRQAIRENALWELVQQRSRSHPKLLEALQFILKKYKKYFLLQDNVSKKSGFFWSGIESNSRPEVIRAKQWARRVNSKKFFVKQPFGKIPVALAGVYPFFQSIVPGYKEKRIAVKPAVAVSGLLNYQFGKGAEKNFKDIDIEISRKTGKIRRIWKQGKLLGTIRPYDSFFLPTVLGAQLLKKHMKKIIIKDSEVASYIKKGSDALAKFCSTKDEVLPGEEVAVLHKGKIIAVGAALLNKKEIGEFERGVAVKVRAT